MNLTLRKGDITKFRGECVVNAANKTLLGGGGVDGAIHEAAGPYLKMECALLNGCEVGEAKITRAYDMNCKKIIHTVGPKYFEMSPELAKEKLIDCYFNSLELAKQQGLHSIAFPAISCGIYKFPFEDACEISLKTILKWQKINKDYKMNVYLFYFSEKELIKAEHILKKLKEKMKNKDL